MKKTRRTTRTMQSRINLVTMDCGQCGMELRSGADSESVTCSRCVQTGVVLSGDRLEKCGDKDRETKATKNRAAARKAVDATTAERRSAAARKAVATRKANLAKLTARIESEAA